MFGVSNLDGTEIIGACHLSYTDQPPFIRNMFIHKDLGPPSHCSELDLNLENMISDKLNVMIAPCRDQ